MKPSDSRAFVNQFLVFLIVMIGSVGSVGIGTVWMRHQISVTADSNRNLAAQLMVVERHISELKALIDIEQSPEALRQRNAEWNLGLVAIADPQTLRVAEDPVQRLAARGVDRAFASEAPGSRSFRVALGQ
jgi:hypothetical protein